MSQANNDKLNFMIKQIISKRNDLSESDIRELIRIKKSKVGAGFLTDLGAMYLILNELGIKIEQKALRLAEIDFDNRVTDVECYYLSSISLPNRVVFYVFDDHKVVRCIYWGSDKAAFEGLISGQGIILKKSIIKELPDGNFELHLNEKSSIEKKSDIKNLELACDELKTNGPGMYMGTVEGPMRVIKFKKKDGSDGKGLSFFLNIKKQKIRAVIWTQNDFEIHEGQELLIGPLTVKRTNYGMELSGDDSIIIKAVGPKFTILDGKDKRFIGVSKLGNLVELEFEQPVASKTIIAKRFQMKGNNFKIFEYEQIKDEYFSPNTSKISSSERGLVKVDFITLSDPALKSYGYYEIMIGDDSGEGKLIIDRDSFNIVSMPTVGQKATALGVYADGKGNFKVTPFSIIKAV